MADSDAAPREGDRGEVRSAGGGRLTAALVSALLAWILPGLGHFYVGKRTRALVFLLVIVGFAVLGIVLDGKLYRPDPTKPLTYLACIADLGLGPGYLGALATGFALGNPRTVTYEHGNTFLLTAGIMNLLLLLDVWDLATGRKS